MSFKYLISIEYLELDDIKERTLVIFTHPSSVYFFDKNLILIPPKRYNEIFKHIVLSLLAEAEIVLEYDEIKATNKVVVIDNDRVKDYIVFLTGLFYKLIGCVKSNMSIKEKLEDLVSVATYVPKWHNREMVEQMIIATFERAIQ